jgi:8-oxo-dGTP pyrophosphatase MutT (NUDIX family)
VTSRMTVQERIDSVARGDNRWEIPPALPAATVVILRPHEDMNSAFDVAMLRRAATMEFAPHMAVFPGGKVDSVDHAFADPIRACAIREVREEVDIHMGELTRWDNWITPEIESMRYDVHFFLGVVPSDTSGNLCTTEAVEMLWTTPQEGLRRSQDGSLPMLHPTQFVLQELAAASGVGELIQLAEQRTIFPRLPRPALNEDRTIRWDLFNAYTMEVVNRGVTKARMETSGEEIA